MVGGDLVVSNAIALPGTPIPTREPERTRLSGPDEDAGLNEDSGTRRRGDTETNTESGQVRFRGDAET